MTHCKSAEVFRPIGAIGAIGTKNECGLRPTEGAQGVLQLRLTHRLPSAVCLGTDRSIRVSFIPLGSPRPVVIMGMPGRRPSVPRKFLPRAGVRAASVAPKLLKSVGQPCARTAAFGLLTKSLRHRRISDD